jgi:3-deoxy-7-phosphoheptulonate synthase
MKLKSIATCEVRLDTDLVIGGEQIVLMAGPCAVESFEQTQVIAQVLKRLGVRIIRGGAFKPRTSPYTFPGLGVDGLQIIREVADEFDMLVITEALGVEQLDLVVRYTDIIQIGSRNMQHFPLLWAAGETSKPVLLKRGFMATIEEWLLAAEHIRQRGNEQIILCERGIRGFDPSTRNVLDVSAVPLVKELSRYPVIVDPSHATGRSDLVLPAGRAAIAAGADGLLVETHPDPPSALSDGDQAIPLDEMGAFVREIETISKAMGRSLHGKVKAE